MQDAFVVYPKLHKQHKTKVWYFSDIVLCRKCKSNKKATIQLTYLATFAATPKLQVQEATVMNCIRRTDTKLFI